MIDDVNIRLLAVRALLEVDENNFSEKIIDKYIKRYNLNSKNSSVLSFIVYSVLEKMLIIDYNIMNFTGAKFHKFSDDIKNILRVGFVGIFYMDSTPTFAAVNESVKLCYKFKKASAKGLVNAILRKVANSENGICFPDTSDMLNYLSVYYSVSKDIVKLLLDQYSIEETKEILSAFNKRNSEISIRVNNLKVSEKELYDILLNENVNVRYNKNLKNNLYISGTGDLNKLQSFKNGLFFVQDTASQLAVSSIPLQKGMLIIDSCSSPGGKSFLCSVLTGDKSEIFSVDKSESKVLKIEDGKKRLNIKNIKTLIFDSSRENKSLQMADVVICDVPCSCLGVISKKPDIRYKTSESIFSFHDIQLKILRQMSLKVKVGGILAYFTCTLNKDENDNVIDDFLLENDSFCPFVFSIDYDNYKNTDFKMTLTPNKINCDGFFICLLKRCR